MRHAKAFTLVDLLFILLLAIAVGAFLFIGSHTHCGIREVANRTMCGTRLSGIYKAMTTYSATNNGTFPSYPTAFPDGPVLGFREGDRTTGVGAVLDNNITAPLWAVVRDGSTSPRNFICASTSDTADKLDSLLRQHVAVDLTRTYDFTERKNLSFSPMNMYHPLLKSSWGANTDAEWVFMADNNANDHPDASIRHRSAPPPPDRKPMSDDQQPLREAENSPNHGYEGQNVMFGDGHVNFHHDPFVGPAGDNVYAYTGEKGNEPPSIANTAGKDADVVLIPLSGNGGGAGSLSGLPLDVVYYPDSRSRRGFTLDDLVLAIGLLAIVIAILIRFIQRRRVRIETTPLTANH